MRNTPNILLLDLDAFFASVEMLDKPSIRKLPVIVGGLSSRGVVSTANYVARQHGVHSGMSTVHARAACPAGVFVVPRMRRYKQVSEQVWGVVARLGAQMEQISIDEAFVDLSLGATQQRYGNASASQVDDLLEDLRKKIARVAQIRCSGGAGSSKMVAKLACETAKPDGHMVVAPGTERSFIAPMPVRNLPGIGGKTAEQLEKVGVLTVRQLAKCSQESLISLFGQAHGQRLYHISRAEDDSEVLPPAERQSIGAEHTFEEDVYTGNRIDDLASSQAAECARRLVAQHKAGRTITVKVKLKDFSVRSRSITLHHATADGPLIAQEARQLVQQIDTSMGVRLLGVSMSHLGDAWQPQLPMFGDGLPSPQQTAEGDPQYVAIRGAYTPGVDVQHDRYGRGWVVSSDADNTCVAFETRRSGPGPRRTLNTNDPLLYPRLDDIP